MTLSSGLSAELWFSSFDFNPFFYLSGYSFFDAARPLYFGLEQTISLKLGSSLTLDEARMIYRPLAYIWVIV